MTWLEEYRLDHTFDSCFMFRQSALNYIMGMREPHYPLPVKYNRDIESPYYYWLFITMTEIRLRNM